MAFAASTVARDPNYQVGDLMSFPMGTTTIYKGDLVVIKASDGYAYSVYETGAEGDSFVGVAAETIVSAGDGEERIRCHQEGIFDFATAADLGQVSVGTMVCSDPATNPSSVADEAGASAPYVHVGKVVDYLSASSVRVKIDVKNSALSAAAL